LSASVIVDGAAKPRLTRGHWAVIVLCSAAYLLDGLTQHILGPLAPAIARTLDLSRPELGPVFSASYAGQAVGLIFISLLPARFGYRPVLVAAVASFGLLEIATGFADSRNHLIALRFLTGIGLGGALPLCLALISDIVPGQRRGLSLMLLMFAFGLGGFLAGVVAGGFLAGEAWRMALWLVGGASLAAAACALFWLPESPTYRSRRERGAGAGPQAGQTKAPSGSPWRIFGRDLLLGTLMLWLAFVGSLAVQSSVGSWLPTLLVDLGRSDRFAALSVSAFTLGGLIASPIVGLLIDRVGLVRVLVGAYLLAAPALFLAGRMLGDASEPVLLGVICLAGILFFGGYGGINVLMAAYFPAELRSVGIGWSKSVSRIGTIAAPVLLGLALAWGVSEQDVVSFASLPLLIVAGAIAVVGWVAKKRSRRDPGGEKPDVTTVEPAVAR
jgi:MFS transporter, AAHS family, 4-hydroxybenzoate transporter